MAVSFEEKFQSLKQSQKLEDEVNQVIKDKRSIFKPSTKNSTKILGSFVFPRSVGEIATDKPPQGADNGKGGIPLWDFLNYNFFHLILVAMFLVYSIIRGCEYFCRRARLKFLELAYNPSQSPQLIRQDVNKLEKIPKKVSVILSLKSEHEEGGGVEGLLNDAGEVTSWCIGSGIPNLTLFEYNGVLKTQVPTLIHSINKSLSNYFGANNLPTFVVKIPRLDLVAYGNGESSPEDYLTNEKPADIEITLISTVNGKKTIADLAKTMADLASKQELQSKDITIDLIDSELTDLSGYEPDLLILFGPVLDLQGYPPWQIRLSEIYWEQDNDDVNYVVFLNALKKFSTCKVNVGK
ncbi:ditrans,polycis-polyprenyl diphosphate synthase [Saccharomycopsis crataegensis]|uniref:ditrans,polycis-polyprenyl diphosphate synthase [(2E,6E)-farnesyldiphosphate specific] n=1 Tax=Saccharomycopsis crataegensis TaxID=43959 RepID=A0AAV5QFI6_9ASCO|nr:ditrans,polycis-polyprenyl diphosphate synthase [Saccharomycopsis crataegensis]